MIRSMTGWGEAERVTPAGRLRVAIRTVNHRHFNASLRTPHGFERLEADIQSWIRPRIARGHVSYQLSLEHGGDRGGDELPVLDLDRAIHYRDLIRLLRQELGLAGDVEVADVVRLGGVFRAPVAVEVAVDVDPEAVRGVTEEAVHALVATRESEGSRLAEDLLERLGAIERELERVRERAPARLAAERDRLRVAVKELTAKESVDEERLAREIAYLAEKWDINEELVRFRAHVEHFRETLAAPAYEAVGKRLGFLVQEMQREANTIGAKANDLVSTRAAMAIKEEIERLREQLENVE